MSKEYFLVKQNYTDMVKTLAEEFVFNRIFKDDQRTESDKIWDVLKGNMWITGAEATTATMAFTSNPDEFWMDEVADIPHDHQDYMNQAAYRAMARDVLDEAAHILPDVRDGYWSEGFSDPEFHSVEDGILVYLRENMMPDVDGVVFHMPSLDALYHFINNSEKAHEFFSYIDRLAREYRQYLPGKYWGMISASASGVTSCDDSNIKMFTAVYESSPGVEVVKVERHLLDDMLIVFRDKLAIATANAAFDAMEEE